MGEEGRELSARELAAALDRMQPLVPLSRDELEDFREMRGEWLYRQERRKRWKAMWPVVFGLASALTSVIAIAVNWLKAK